MFESCIERLLAGDIICEVTAPDQVSWLLDPQNLSAANAFLDQIGRRVETAEPGGFYATYASGRSGPKSQVTKLHKELVGELRPMLQFIRFILDTKRTDIRLRVGDLIEVNALLAVIDGNDALRVELRDVASRVGGRHDTTDRGLFTAVVRHLANAGYLHQVHVEREIYRATGKVQLLYETSDFLMENMAGVPEAMAAAEKQGQLL